MSRSYKMFNYGCGEGFNLILSKIPLEKRDEMSCSLASLREAGDEFMIYCGRCAGASSDEVMKQVVGRGGCYFKRTTTECDIDFIWHDRKNNQIEFWGPKENVILAINIIQSRINKIQIRKDKETKEAKLRLSKK